MITFPIPFQKDYLHLFEIHLKTPDVYGFSIAWVLLSGNDDVLENVLMIEINSSYN